ncbi:MAG: PEP-CTERM sorting domain-containing protein, partial [Verrucomicrobiae bacterium]|nr:PEP-CTERM sorting domain-containing protein [Verrucomicrobiae bacterium]
RGPGTMLFQRRVGTDAWGGTVANLVRIGLDGQATPENPLAIQSQNSLIVDLIGAAALPNAKTMTIRDGQIRIRGGDNLGITSNTTNTTLVVGKGGSLRPDDAAGNNAANITLNRGKIIFEDDGAIYTGTEPDSLAASTNIILSGMAFSQGALLILNDGSAGTANTPSSRFLNNSLYNHVLSNMNVVFSDDALRTVRVDNASSFALGEGRYLTHARNSNGNFNRLMTFSGSTTNDVPITAAAGVTQVHFIATRDGGTFRINPSIDLPTTDLVVGRTNDFITVLDDSSTRNTNTVGAGTVRLDGSSNTFQNVRVVSGALIFHDEITDQTRINGNLIFDPVNPGNTNTTYHRVFGGDFQVTSNIVVNESGALPGAAQVGLFKIEAQGDDFNSPGVVTNGDGRGLMERLLNGTLALGPDGVVVKDNARFEVGALRTNGWIYEINQKITIDNTGPNFSAGQRNLDFRGENGTNSFTGLNSGTPTFYVPNIVMRDGSYLRINENNSIVRAGLILEGTNYITEGSSAETDDFDLLNVRSSQNGVGRLLYIGGTNSSLPDPDTNLDVSLFGTGTPDITFFVFNNTFRSQVSSGGDVQGNVIVRSGSTFAIVGGLDAINDLSGNGTVAGAVQVGGTLSPGLVAFTPATLTVNGSNLFTSTSILDFDLAGSNTVTGNAINDYLAITGAGYLALDGTLNVNGLSSFAGRGTNDFWTIITYAGSFTNNTLNLGVMPVLDAGLAWAIDTSVNGQVRLGIVIPEPTTWALIGIGLGVIAVASRRRR